MSNNYFRFKQFTVYQNKAAMKVGVDAVTLGAYADLTKARSIIDIGTGTGLLSLMAAQKSDAKITAIEIDKNSVEQAAENFQQSPWTKRISLMHISFQDFAKQSKTLFDAAICNPPYFNNSYQSPDKNRNKARQDVLLPLPDLFEGLKRVLKKEGCFYMIYPYLQKDNLLAISQYYQFYPFKILEIKPYENKKANRIIFGFSSNKKNIEKQVLIVRDLETQQYSRQYKDLTKDFYLNF